MIQKKLLGNTNIEISAVGLGTVKFGRNQGVRYPKQFELPTDHEILHLLSVARELGINFLDTAPAYGSSEERLGKLLKNTRDDWILCTKVGEDFINGESHFDFSLEGVRLSVERSLAQLRTDYLDVVLVHSNGDDVKIIEQFGVFEALSSLKQAGKIRAFGMSTKTIEGGILAVDQSDVVMVTYNPAQTEERPVLVEAEKRNKGILIKKALASGHLDKFAVDDPVRFAMNFIFAEPSVTSIVLGTLDEKHLRYNVQCAVDALSRS